MVTNTKDWIQQAVEQSERVHGHPLCVSGIRGLRGPDVCAMFDCGWQHSACIVPSILGHALCYLTVVLIGHSVIMGSNNATLWADDERTGTAVASSCGVHVWQLV